VTNEELISLAASVVNPRKTKHGLWGDVGSAVLSARGKVYLGVCADLGSYGFCAEQNAIGCMMTDGQVRIAKIVAVWKDEDGSVHVLSPCGHCRQMMMDLDEANLGAEVALDHDKTVTLEELLPHHTWWKKQ
jgi:cytidine deaminase